VRIPSTNGFGAILDGITRDVRASDNGLSNVAVRSFRLSNDTPTVAVALACGLELPADLTRFELARALGRFFDTDPRVLVIDCTDNAPRHSGRDLESLIDLATKTAPTASPTLIIVDTFREPQSATFYDLAHGAPVPPPSVDLPAGAPLWRQYLHVRIAWETGGDPWLAASWNPDGVLALPPGDDNAFERLLNQEALRRWSQLSDQDRNVLIAHLVDPHAVAPRQRALAELDNRLLFARPHSDYSAPVPWVARACLLSNAAPPAADRLRGALVCTPLAMEILASCFEFERRLRTSLLHQEGGMDPPPEVQEEAQQFASAVRSYTRSLYPADSPALPTDPWTFASIGKVVHAMKALGRVADSVLQLRNLRNAIAHGHYVSWRAVADSRELGRFFRKLS
jgi:hypothetical protein